MKNCSIGSRSPNVPICKFWLAGDCRKNSGRFANLEIEAPVDPALRLNQMRFKQSPISQRQLKANIKGAQKNASDDCVAMCNPCENRKINSPENRVIRLNRSFFQLLKTLQRQL